MREGEITLMASHRLQAGETFFIITLLFVNCDVNLIQPGEGFHNAMPDQLSLMFAIRLIILFIRTQCVFSRWLTSKCQNLSAPILINLYLLLFISPIKPFHISKLSRAFTISQVNEPVKFANTEQQIVIVCVKFV